MNSKKGQVSLEHRLVLTVGALSMLLRTVTVPPYFYFLWSVGRQVMSFLTIVLIEYIGIESLSKAPLSVRRMGQLKLFDD